MQGLLNEIHVSFRFEIRYENLCFIDYSPLRKEEPQYGSSSQPPSQLRKSENIPTINNKYYKRN
jgi:hypothetical protein